MRKKTPIHATGKTRHIAGTDRRAVGATGGIRHRFIFVLGSSPQVVTETLWWFAKKNRPAVIASEVHILTTTLGAEDARRRLLGKTGHLAKFSADFKAPNPTTSLTVLTDSKRRPLKDIRSTDDNESASLQIFRVVAEMTADPAVICHFSVAGGRRTLGLHLASAAMFFARDRDTLSHVLVPPDMESDPAAFYPSPGDAGRGVDLAFLPFLRLREHARAGFSFADYIRTFQRRLDHGFSLPCIEVNLERCEIRAGEATVRLPRQQMALWCVYALVSEKGLSLDELLGTHKAFGEYLRRTGAVPESAELMDAWQRWSRNESRAQDDLEGSLLQLRSKLSRRIRMALSDPYLDGFVNIRILGDRARPVRYGVKIGRSKIRIVED